MLVECPKCNAVVDGTVIGEREMPDAQGEPPYKVMLLACPVCQETVVGISEYVQVAQDDYDWDSPASRVWPSPPERFHGSIPALVRDPLMEASACLKVKAYSACAVMCGKALEGICRMYGDNKDMLGKGLDALKEQGVIDKRLYEWGCALRVARNVGAHASETVTTREDARDILDFAKAICEYVFVLTARYDAFKKRQAERGQGGVRRGPVRKLTKPGETNTPSA